MTLFPDCAIFFAFNTPRESVAVTDKTENKNEVPETAADPIAGEHRQARPGVKDDGDIVTTAGGELMSGLIADIADGDT